MNHASRLPELSPAQVRAALLARDEIALIDVREEDPFAQAHPLWAVQLSTTRIELDAPWRLPRRDVTIAVYDDGEGLAEPAARRLQALGYTAVHLLSRDGRGSGLAVWREAGGELFRDVNVPSKSFGELVEHERHTPSLAAEEVKALIDAGTDMVVLDARRFDEYATMSIPTGTSVPGAELALRVRELAPNPATRVIVNCAGRTRSIIGTQSLVNAGIPNPVAALRNGTIGWLLAGQTLDHGQQRRFQDRASRPSAPNLAAAQAAAQALADRAGARRIDADMLAQWQADTTRTLYRWDVRTPEEYAAGHWPGFGSAPGGQLVQETDVNAAVRGARIVLCDGGATTDAVRAPMTAHWLAQMGWEVAWLTDAGPDRFTDAGPWQPAHTPLPEVPAIDADTLAAGLNAGDTWLLDLGPSAQYVRGHVPGAQWALRSELPALLGRALAQRPGGLRRLVLGCPQGRIAPFALADLQALPVLQGLDLAVLAGGQAAWVAAGRPLHTGEGSLLSPRIDRYRRPYEGTDAPREAMQGYLDWEFGLVAQLGRDGTHHFQVLPAA
ncbi:rhodanese-like domain-containing protein [Ideonella sp. DXS22W]|uniref:Rhodanese-like domain-containing protein n=1 Tax=Pseudaquabacterium inlustre TaxID=2984192 RepID=A0ABU9CIA9_9BURK